MSDRFNEFAGMYRFEIVVKEYDTYGKFLKKHPAVVYAKNKEEVTTKVREFSNATYDDFRGFWSHDWLLVKVEEVLPKELPGAQQLPGESLIEPPECCRKAQFNLPAHPVDGL